MEIYSDYYAVIIYCLIFVLYKLLVPAFVCIFNLFSYLR